MANWQQSSTFDKIQYFSFDMPYKHLTFIKNSCTAIKVSKNDDDSIRFDTFALSVWYGVVLVMYVCPSSSNPIFNARQSRSASRWCHYDITFNRLGARLRPWFFSVMLMRTVSLPLLSLPDIDANCKRCIRLLCICNIFFVSAFECWSCKSLDCAW